MAPTLIVLGLLVLGVAIVAWATRRRPGQPRVVRHEQDVVWDDVPDTQDGAPKAVAPTAPLSDPFADAPPPSSETEPRP